MKIFKTIWGKFLVFKDWFFKAKPPVKIIIMLLVIGIGWTVVKKISPSKTQKTQYQTTKAEKGTLTVVVTASGQVVQANSATVDTQASGVVSKIYVENGQNVQSGDKIAEIDLDMVGKQRSASAWSSYLAAKNSLENANISYYTLRSDMLTKWKTYMDLAQSSSYQNSDGSPKTDARGLPQFYSVSDDWLATEAKYKLQQSVVAQAQSSLNSSWLSYQQTSSIIYAPISGTVTGLSLQIGSVLTAQSNTSGTATSQKIASIQTGASPLIQVSLSQIDTPKVQVGNKATLIFDAFPGKTFTGKVVSIDTIGTVSSGVTTYTAVIKLDTEVPEIFSNMTVSASIITQVKNDVLIIPSSAVQSQNGQSVVRILNNGQVKEVDIETGISSNTDVEVVSGLSEGDTVVTNASSSINGNSQSRNQTQSPFGGFGGGVFRGR